MINLRGVAGLIALIALWHFASLSNNVLVPPLSEILLQYQRLLSNQIIQTDIVASLWRIIIGVAISTTIAAVLGMVSAFWAEFAEYMSGIVELLRPIPPIAWTPIAIIGFGIGSKPAIAIVVIGSLFPIWMGIQQGLKEVKQSHLLAAGSLGASKFLVFTDVILPSVIPFFMHGLRIGVGLAWFCVIAAEMVGASSGLGYGIQLYSLNIEMSKVYCYLFTIGVLGLLSNSLLLKLNRGVVNWDSND